MCRWRTMSRSGGWRSWRRGESLWRRRSKKRRIRHASMKPASTPRHQTSGGRRFNGSIDVHGRIVVGENRAKSSIGEVYTQAHLHRSGSMWRSCAEDDKDDPRQNVGSPRPLIFDKDDPRQNVGSPWLIAGSASTPSKKGVSHARFVEVWQSLSEQVQPISMLWAGQDAWLRVTAWSSCCTRFFSPAFGPI
jgi:hypothetical protein